MALTLRPIEPERCAGEMTYYVWGDDGSAALRFVIPKLEFAEGCGINRVGLDEFLARQGEVMAAGAAAYERRKRRLKDERWQGEYLGHACRLHLRRARRVLPRQNE